MKESKKNCPHCGGNGKIAHYHDKVWSPEHLRRREAYTSYSTCSQCKGTGEISRVDKGSKLSFFLFFIAFSIYAYYMSK